MERGFGCIVRTGRFRAAGAFLAVAGLGGLAGPAAAQRVTEVPLRVVGNWLVVPVVTAGGDTLAFALDTAAGISVLTDAGADRLEARPAGRATVVGARGPEEVGMAVLPPLRLGDLTMASGPRPVLRDATLTTEGGVTLDGAVGIDVLRGYDVLVDVPGGRLVLRPPSSDPWPGEVGALLGPGRAFTLVQGGFIRTEAWIDGTAVTAVLDTGAREHHVTSAAATVAGLTARGPSAPLARRGVGTADVQVEGWPARVARLALGDAVLTGVDVTVADLPVFGILLPGQEAVALVGSPFFQRCAVAIEYRAARLRTCRAAGGGPGPD